MLRLRTIVAFVGGLIVALLVGLVPPELIGWFRDWAAREDATADAEPARELRRRRSRKQTRRGSRS